MATKDNFSNPDSEQIALIDKITNEYATDIFDIANGNKLVRQSIPVTQIWNTISPMKDPTFAATTDGGNIQFQISQGSFALQEMISRIYFTLSAGVTPCPLAPYFWYNKFSVVQGTTVIIKEINPQDGFVTWLFENLPTELQNWLVDLAADQTTAVGGTVEQIMVWPLYFISELLTGIARPPVPCDNFASPMIVNFTPLAINKWCTAVSFAGATATMAITTYLKKVCYDPRITSPTVWQCAMKVPVFTDANTQNYTDGAFKTVGVVPSNVLISSELYFYMRNANQMLTTAGGNDYLHGQLPDEFLWLPIGTAQNEGMTSKGMVKVFMRSQELKGNFYNPSTTTSSLSLNTSENNFSYGFGPKNTVQDLLALYQFKGGQDKSVMKLKFNTIPGGSGTVTALTICVMLLEMRNGQIFFVPGSLTY